MMWKNTDSTGPSRLNVKKSIECEEVGILFKGPGIKEYVKTYHRFTCSCGVTVTFPLNGLPLEDTLMPCGNPKHWVVRYEDT